MRRGPGPHGRPERRRLDIDRRPEIDRRLRLTRRLEVARRRGLGRRRRQGRLTQVRSGRHAAGRGSRDRGLCPRDLPDNHRRLPAGHLGGQRLDPAAGVLHLLRQGALGGGEDERDPPVLHLDVAGLGGHRPVKEPPFALQLDEEPLLQAGRRPGGGRGRGGHGRGPRGLARGRGGRRRGPHGRGRGGRGRGPRGRGRRSRGADRRRCRRSRRGSGGRRGGTRGPTRLARRAATRRRRSCRRRGAPDPGRGSLPARRAALPRAARPSGGRPRRIEPAGPIEQLGQRHQPPQVNPAQHRHLEVVARLRRVADVELGPRQHVEPAQQVLPREPVRERLQALALGVGGDLGVGDAARVHLQHHQVAHQPGELAAHRAQVVPRLDETAGQVEDPVGRLRRHRLRHVEHRVAGHQPQHRRHLGGAYRLAREGDDLVEGALGVAHAAAGGAGDQREAGLVDGDLLRLHNLPELLGDGGGADGAELEDLRARENRVGNLVEQGRRHDEHDVRRRLLDRLEQGVERARRELVHLVDDEDLVAVADRGDGQPRDDHLADVVDLGVGGGVDLEHVDVAPLGHLAAHVALAAWVGRGPLDAVQGAGENAGRRRLAHPPRPREHERLGDPLAGDGVAQGLGDPALAHDVVEALRPPLAGENLIGHAVRGRRAPAATRKSLRHMSVTT